MIYSKIFRIMEISLKSTPTNSVSGLNQEQKSLLHYVPGKTGEESALAVKRNFNRKSKAISDVPSPFLKWAGGKRSLLTQFDAYFPTKFNKYIEPFVGGGSVFFYLLPEKAILMDNNDELINCYLVIQNHIEELISSLKQHRYEKIHFYKIRNVDRNPEEFSQWTDIERAARTIYLNKCCYNGLYRVNSKGEFNVPFGLHKNPNFCDEPNLRAVHQILKNVKTFKSSFETCLDFAEENEAQIQLGEVFRELDQKGCKIMLSNSYNKLILDLYQQYRIITVNAKRVINSIATKRGEIKEVLILNY
jgi:DNA adenine methylase